MDILEEVGHCGGRVLGLLYIQAMSSSSVHFLLPADQDAGLSAPRELFHMSVRTNLGHL